MIVLLLLVTAALVVLGAPVAVSMGLGTAAALVAHGDVPLLLLPQRILTASDSFSLLAIPLFILAGTLMETGGIARRLIALPLSFIGHVRGALAHVVVIAEIFFSGISGSSLADVSAIGSVLLPPMQQAGYSKAESVAIVSTASALGILVPPCILMVVIGGIANLSVGRLFLAGVLPALVMAAIMIGYIYIVARRGKFPPAKQHSSWRERARVSLDSLLSLFMPVLIFGSILGGIATVTETAVLAVLYAFLVSVVIYREVRLDQIPNMFISCARTTGAIMLMVGVGSAMSWVLASEGAPKQLSALLLGSSLAPWMFLMLTNVVFILLGATIEGLPASIIMLPVLMPIANNLGIDPYHFAITIVVTSGIGAFLPPIGVGALIACGLTGLDVGRLMRPMLPYLVVLLLGLLVVTFVPWFTLAVPDALMPK